MGEVELQLSQNILYTLNFLSVVLREKDKSNTEI